MNRNLALSCWRFPVVGTCVLAGVMTMNDPAVPGPALRKAAIS